MGTMIEVADVGPVVEFSGEMDGPGVYVLEGKQGAGKSTILRTIELAVDGEVTGEQPSKRVGAKAGTATVAGKTVKISRTVRSEGELSVDGLGDLDLTVLHGPKYQKADDRDKYRIAALVKLGGGAATAADFQGKLPDELWVKVVPACPATDAIGLAKHVKKSLDAAALEEEKAAAALSNSMAMSFEQWKHVRQDVSQDVDALRAAQQAALVEQQQLVAERRAGLQRQTEREQQRQQLAAMQKPDVLTAKGVFEAYEVQVSLQQEAVKGIETQIAELQQKLETQRFEYVKLRDRMAVAQYELKSAQDLAATIEELERSVEQSQAVEVPSEQDITAAGENLALAGKAIEDARLAGLAREAAANRANAKGLMEAAEQRAVRLREAAANVSLSLSAIVSRIPGCPLRVRMDEDGTPRLVVDRPGRGEVLFDELSDGERWDVIVPLALKQNRLIVLHQAAWGELSPSTRKHLAKLTEEAGGYVVTGQALDCPLRLTRYQG